jgi:hypothetical protein
LESEKRVGAGVGGVDQANAVEARLDFKIGEDGAVGEDDVAVNFWNPGRFGVARIWVVELAVGVEEAVGNGERDFVFASGQVERVFLLRRG